MSPTDVPALTAMFPRQQEQKLIDIQAQMSPAHKIIHYTQVIICIIKVYSDPVRLHDEPLSVRYNNVFYNEDSEMEDVIISDGVVLCLIFLHPQKKFRSYFLINKSTPLSPVFI
jgi:hypothetical protein